MQYFWKILLTEIRVQYYIVLNCQCPDIHVSGYQISSNVPAIWSIWNCSAGQMWPESYGLLTLTKLYISTLNPLSKSTRDASVYDFFFLKASWSSMCCTQYREEKQRIISTFNTAAPRHPNQNAKTYCAGCCKRQINRTASGSECSWSVPDRTWHWANQTSRSAVEWEDKNIICVKVAWFLFHFLFLI